MNDTDVSAGMTERLGAELIGFARVKVKLPEILDAWNTASPELTRDTSRHAALAVALDALAASGTIELPKGAWDRSTVPPLPQFVTVPAARRPPAAKPWREFPWCAELAWCAELVTLKHAHYEDLVAVNRWLAAGGRAAPVTPVQVRSLQIFGNEKRLLDLAGGTRLFAPDRLSFELLRCRRYPPPLAHERVGPGGRWLIVENSDSFWLSRDAARATGAFDVVGWGAGGNGIQSILSLLEHQGPVESLYYWGDVDPAGVTIATDIAAACGAVGLPDLLPAASLWNATATAAIRDKGTVDWKGTDLRWLGRASDSVANVIATAGRVPQEALDGAAIEAVLNAAT